MDYRYEVLDREPCHTGFFRVTRCRLRHQLYAGGWSPPIERELLERGHAAALIPYDPVRDELVLVEQFRVGALDACGGPWMLEFIAGIVEPGESYRDVVVREAAEEAGLEVVTAEFVTEFVLSPGGCSERLALYCARVDTTAAGGLFGIAAEGEDIRARVMSREDALALVDSPNPLSAMTLIGLQWLALNHRALRARWLDETPTR